MTLRNRSQDKLSGTPIDIVRKAIVIGYLTAVKDRTFRMESLRDLATLVDRHSYIREQNPNARTSTSQIVRARKLLRGQGLIEIVSSADGMVKVNPDCDIFRETLRELGYGPEDE